MRDQTDVPPVVASRGCAFARLLLLTLFTLSFLQSPGAAAQTNGVRPYLHWRVGEFAPAWEVLDLRGFSLGADVGRRWSVELALDAWQLDLQVPTIAPSLGEQQIITLGPLFRYRIPLGNERVVLYPLASVGGAWVQFNDRMPGGIGHTIDSDGMTFTAAAGAGLDLFLADNIAFNLEGKYAWCNPFDIHVDGARHDWDASSFLATFGLRVYFDRHPNAALFRKAGTLGPVRLFLGTQGGFTILTDGDWVPGAKVEPKVNAPGGTLNINYALSLGADFGERFGVELSMVHTEYSLSLPGQGAIGEYSMYSIIPMLRLRCPSDSGRWVPYVMAGAGVTYGEFNDVKPQGSTLTVSAKGVQPAFAVGAGIEYFLARNVSFNAEGRWRYSMDNELEIQGGPSGKGDLSEVQFTIGFRAYLFEFGRGRQADE